MPDGCRFPYLSCTYMPKDIRLIGHIATFRNVFEMFFLNHSYVVIKKNTIFAGKKVVHTPLKGVVRTIIMQKKRL